MSPTAVLISKPLWNYANDVNDDIITISQYQTSNSKAPHYNHFITKYIQYRVISFPRNKESCCTKHKKPRYCSHYLWHMTNWFLYILELVTLGQNISLQLLTRRKTYSMTRWKLVSVFERIAAVWSFCFCFLWPVFISSAASSSDPHSFFILFFFHFFHHQFSW